MTRSRALVVSTFVAMVVAACGGGGSNGGSNGGGGGTGGGGGGGTTPTNPCNTALLADTAEVAAVGTVLQSGHSPQDKKTIIDGDPRGRVYEAIALHKDAVERRSGQARAAAVTDAGVESRRENAITSPSPVAEDIGDIAVLQDTGDLVLPQNTYDLRSTGLRFTRSGSSYTLSHIDGNFRANLGNRVTLGDDDSAGVAIPFSFPFYGNAQTAAFVNSDGNITFGEEEHSSTDRNVARLLTGPPRVAPFFADLDPSQGTGKIFVNAASDQYTVTWCGVRGFDSQRSVTTQATLFPDGSVEFKYGDSINLTDSVVALSPGHTATFTTVDLTTSTA